MCRGNFRGFPSPILCPCGWKDFIIANVNVFSTQTTCEANIKQKFVVIWATEKSLLIFFRHVCRLVFCKLKGCVRRLDLGNWTAEETILPYSINLPQPEIFDKFRQKPLGSVFLQFTCHSYMKPTLELFSAAFWLCFSNTSLSIAPGHLRCFTSLGSGLQLMVCHCLKMWLLVFAGLHEDLL